MAGELKLLPRETGLAAENTAGQRYEALLRISRAIPGCSTPEELFRVVAKELEKVLSFKELHVLIYKDNSTDVQWHALGPADIPYPHLPVQETQSWWVHINQQPLIIPDWDEETRFPRLKQFMQSVNIRSSCRVPLATKHRRLGAFGVGSGIADSYSEEDLKFLSLIADHVALAFDDALNFATSQHVQAELQLERDRLTVLLELTNRLVSTLDLKDLLRSICVSVRPVMNCNSASLMLPDPTDNRLRIHIHHFPENKMVIREGTLVRGYLPRKVFRTGQHWAGNLRDLPPAYLKHDRGVAEGLKTMCVFPLVNRNRTLGTLCLGRLEERPFSEDEIKFCVQIANQSAVAVDNALIFEELRRARIELERNEAFLAEGQRLSHTGSWRWQVRSANFFWSEEQFRIFGFDPKETKLSKRLLCRRIHPQDRQLLRSAASRAVTKKSDLECDFRVVLPDESVRNVHCLGHPVFDDSGSLIEFVGTSMDVTSRKRVEDEKAILGRVQERFDSLTNRERQVMQHVTAGMLNKQIAGELAISEIMVKVHRRKMMKKMRAESLAELARMAERILRASSL
jgi:GAF domain-containing protein/DNA-binding CsgD family transcriptional regulator